MTARNVVAAGVTLRVVDPRSEPALAALSRYVAELDDRFDGGFDPGPGLTDSLDQFDPPAGAFVIAEIDGELAGCAGLRALDASTAEIKRMWVDPACRGLGVGGRLLAEVERLAAENGAERVLLDTNDSLTEAIAMYRRRGYTEIPAYNDNPDARLWFSKPLQEKSGGSLSR